LGYLRGFFLERRNMARYSVGSGGTALAARAAGAGVIGILAGANPITVYEIGCFAGSAVAWNLGVIRAATNGTASTSVIPVPDTAGTPLARLTTAWSAAPTIGTNVYMRQVGIPSAIGNGYTFIFPSGILVAANSSLLVWSITASPTSFNHVVYDE
jgi:hypothetical protein